MQTYENERLPAGLAAETPRTRRTVRVRRRRVALHPMMLILLLALALGIGGSAGGAAAIALVGRGSAGVPSKALGSAQVTLIEDSAVVDVVKQISPAVVTVVSDLPPQRSSSGRRLRETSSGSGVVIDNGYIITNEHVVHDGQTISVILSDGRKLPAQLVGTDAPFTDLAVIRVAEENLPLASFGDSDALTAGQRVIAIGSALGDFRNTVTMGIVSGLHRTWRGDGSGGDAVVMEDLIQTDAAINHGNSGGPLVNALGQIVGINTSVIRATQAGEPVEGIGFAIPSNTVQEVAKQLVERGRVARPYLGVQHQQINPSVASLYALPVRHGVFVLKVSPNSPAEKAGIVEGDIITKIGGVGIDAEHPFLNVLMRFGPKDKVTITVNRDGKEMGLEVLLTERQ